MELLMDSASSNSALQSFLVKQMQNVLLLLTLQSFIRITDQFCTKENELNNIFLLNDFQVLFFQWVC